MWHKELAVDLGFSGPSIFVFFTIADAEVLREKRKNCITETCFLATAILAVQGMHIGDN